MFHKLNITMITDQQIEELIEPHKLAIRQWYNSALLKLEQVKEIMEVEVYKRLSAILINNYVLEKAKSYFNDYKEVAGIVINDRYKSLIIYFQKDGTTTRFKKLNKDTLLSSNIKTTRNVQMIQGSLFSEYPPVVGIEIGHIFNEIGTAYDKILVVKRVDEKIAIPLFEIPELDNVDITVVPAQEIEIDLNKEEQLKIKKAI